MCVCVVSYFVMMGVLTWYTTCLERGIFCTALNKDAAGIDPDDVWNASSSLKRSVESKGPVACPFIVVLTLFYCFVIDVALYAVHTKLTSIVRANS